MNTYIPCAKLRKVSARSFSSLDSSKVLILDSGNDVFVWVGKDRSNEVRCVARVCVHEYIHTFTYTE
jgi:hypothetical protein